MFPVARKTLGSDRLQELGKRIEERKEELMAESGR